MLKVGQNIKYDMACSARTASGWRRSTTPCCCPMCWMPALHGHGMDELAEAPSRPRRRSRYDDVAGSRQVAQVAFDQVPLDKARDYAAEDADVTLRLWALLQAAARAERMVDRLRDHRAAADPGGGRMEHGRHQGRPRRAVAALVRRFREADGSSSSRRSTSSPAGRSTSARPSSWARCCSTSMGLPGGRRRARPAPMRPTPTSWRSWRRRAMTLPARCWTGASSPSSRAPTPMRWSQRDRRRDGPRAYLLPAGRRRDRAAVLDRSQPAEHPDPHRGRPQDPPGLHRRAGPQAAVGRLFADRAQAARAHGRHRRAEAGVRARRSTSTP